MRAKGHISGAYSHTQMYWDHPCVWSRFVDLDHGSLLASVVMGYEAKFSGWLRW